MRELSQLRPEQKRAIDFLYGNIVKDAPGAGRGLLWADVGTGKTAIALTVLDYWLTDGIAERALILAPLRVCQQVWRQEAREWAHLYDLADDMRLVQGHVAQRKALVESDARILLMNYELLPWFFMQYPEAAGCDTLICDEIDKCKSPRSLRFKGGRRKVKGTTVRVPGLQEKCALFANRLGMTGTPVPNHLLDLWAQVFILDEGYRLGLEFDDYRDTLFRIKNAFATWHTYMPVAGAQEAVTSLLKDLTFRIELPEDASIPQVRELPPRVIELSPQARKAYKELENYYITQVDEGTISAVHAGALYGKLRQLAQGFVYGEPLPEMIRVGPANWLGMAKMYELQALISELQGQQLLIVYAFTAQLHKLRDTTGLAPGLKALHGGQTAKEARQVIESWNSGECELLAVQPMAAGHGLNLQLSHARHIAMLTLPESAGLYKQVLGRLVRLGNKAEVVTVHHFQTAGTIDEERMKVVQGKLTTQEEILAAMKERQNE